MNRTLIALLTLVALPLAAAQSIEVWHSLSNNFGAPEFEAFAETFDEEHPDIDVEVVYSGAYAEAVTKAQAAVAAGNPPHVLMLEQTRGPGFVDADAMLPLEPLIESDPDFDLSDFPEPLLATCRIDGTLYCLPFNPSTPVIFYNRDMFREAGLDPDEDVPATWDELLDVGERLAERDASGELSRWAIGLPSSPRWFFDAWLGQAGGSYLNEEGDAFVFDDEHGVAVAEFWLELVEAGAAKPLRGPGVAAAGPDFYGGNQAMMMGSTAAIENVFAQADFDVGVAPFWCGERCYVPIGGANLYLPRQGDDEEHQAAWEFLTYVTDAERTAEFAAATGYMAVRQSALDTETMRTRFEQIPEARITYDQMESHGHPRTLVAFWNDVQAQIDVAAEKILLDDQDPGAALAEAASEANRLLEVYRR